MTFITDTVAIGDCRDADDKHLFGAYNLRSMVSLNGQMIGRTASHLGMHSLAAFDFHDGPGNPPALFDAALQALLNFERDCPNVLVHCQMGMSRSAVVVAGFPMVSRGMHADDALDYIAARRHVCLSGGILNLIYQSVLIRSSRLSP